MFKYKNKLSHSLQAVCVIPLLIFGVIIILFSSYSFHFSMYRQVEEELNNMAKSVLITIDICYPGYYRLDQDNEAQFYKNSRSLLPALQIIDKIKEDTGLDVTIFRGDTRFLTTIHDLYGNRLSGTKAPDQVVEDVLLGGDAHFYTHTTINDSNFFSYYTPLTDKDGQIVGMLFIGKPDADVRASLDTAFIHMAITNILFLILSICCTWLFARSISNNLHSLRSFLSKVSTGNLNTVLDRKILHRNDELGEIAHSALFMQQSLRKLVERDSLTGLYNRRCGDTMLRQTMEEASAAGKPFSVSIGDIDFFKKINDTYGHECGDLVLKNIAELLNCHMDHKGFAARWGGEEFLLVFKNSGEDTALKYLEKLMNDVRSLVTEYDGRTVRVTMTFGLASGMDRDLNQLLRLADSRLYEGKAAGRNKIFS